MKQIEINNATRVYVGVQIDRVLKRHWLGIGFQHNEREVQRRVPGIDPN